MSVSFLRRLLGKPPRNTQPATPSGDLATRIPVGSDTKVYTGNETLEVVGESHYQGNLWSIVGCEPTDARVRCPCVAVLVAETDNQYDPNAISVRVNGLQVGHLSRDDAAEYRPGLLRLAKNGPVGLSGTIVGGGYGGTALLGVFLDHDPVAFGVATVEPSPGELRTGLTEAQGTDDLDDSYQLNWLYQLPEDTPSAVQTLRQLLDHESDLLDRHFMYAELESRLYRLRDTGADALAGYDKASGAHDDEMDDIRPLLLAKFGAIPLLETYKQQSIRQRKERNWNEGLRWAHRGLSLYGDEPAKQDWVDDLRKRASYFQAKIEGESSPPTPPRRARSRNREASKIELLTCTHCGRTWKHVRKSGRKPILCDDCQALG